MLLLSIPSIIGGSISILICIVLIILIFKVIKGIFKFLGGLIVIGLIVLAVLFFLGII